MSTRQDDGTQAAASRLDALLNRQPKPSILDDDASLIGRQEKIEVMRKRVESQLAAMVNGGTSEFDKLRQQVANLRTQPVLTGRSDPNNSVLEMDQDMVVSQDMMEGISSRETTVSEMLLDDAAGGLLGEGTDYATFLANSIEDDKETTEPDDDEDEETKYAENASIKDPYGDSGLYTGELSSQQSKPHGLGTMRYKDGRTYSGGWKHGQWHGKGVAVFNNGDKFDGAYDLDRRHGFGTYRWKDGRVYEGEFHCDQRQGCGEYRWPDGAEYRGEFVGGHREGEGTYTFADGSQYTGEWFKGRYHGVGQCTWKDGRVYKGEWKEGKAHGFGVEKRSNGAIRHEGMWEHDHPVRK